MTTAREEHCDRTKFTWQQLLWTVLNDMTALKTEQNFSTHREANRWQRPSILTPTMNDNNFQVRPQAILSENIDLPYWKKAKVSLWALLRDKVNAVKPKYADAHRYIRSKNREIYLQTRNEYIATAKSFRKLEKQMTKHRHTTKDVTSFELRSYEYCKSLV